MDLERIEALARKGSIEQLACAIRLRAARLSVGLTQADVAQALGRRTQTISNMEKARSLPSAEVMRYFWRQHRIDFNFLMAGDAGGLRADDLERLLPALEDANSVWDQKSRSDRPRTSKQK